MRKDAHNLGAIMFDPNAVNIKCVFLIGERAIPTTAAGDTVKIADCQSHRDWLTDEHGQIIPSQWRYAIVKKAAKNGSVLIDGKWYKPGISSIYFNSDCFGTTIIFI